MKKIKIFLAVVFGFAALAAVAGPKYNVTFYNNSDKVVNISPAENGDWFPGDFGKNWTIPPNKHITIYTESKALKDGSVGVDLSTDSGKFSHVAIWINKHSPRPVNCNVSQSSPMNKEWIGTSNPKVTTTMSTDIEGSTGGIVTANVYIPKDAF
ncbi:MAG: hypothetical protein WCR55_08865 [Lentisphaerota bacterium]